MIDLPIVTQEEFDKIECNRCGQCCENFHMDLDTVVSIVMGTKSWTDPVRSKDWALHIIPNMETESRFHCTYFQRQEDGLGFCTNHENRPDVCRGFPYGKPPTQENFSKCSYNVVIQDTSP